MCVPGVCIDHGVKATRGVSAEMKMVSCKAEVSIIGGIEKEGFLYWEE